MDYVKKLYCVYIFLLGMCMCMDMLMPIPILDGIITFTLMMVSIAIAVYDHLYANDSTDNFEYKTFNMCQVFNDLNNSSRVETNNWFNK